MKKFTPAISAILTCLALNFSAFADDSGWQLKKDSDGIQVYTRKTEGEALNEFRARTIFHADLKEVIRFFEDTPRVTSWMYKCTAFSELERRSDVERIFYFRQALSWPAADRDAVLHRIRTDAPSGAETDFLLTAIPDGPASPAGVVRMPRVRTSWHFISKTAGEVEAEYEVSSDPGGNLPKWLVNQMAIDLPFNTLKQFRSDLRG